MNINGAHITEQTKPKDTYSFFKFIIIWCDFRASKYIRRKKNLRENSVTIVISTIPRHQQRTLDNIRITHLRCLRRKCFLLLFVLFIISFCCWVSSLSDGVRLPHYYAEVIAPVLIFRFVGANERLAPHHISTCHPNKPDQLFLNIVLELYYLVSTQKWVIG